MIKNNKQTIRNDVAFVYNGASAIYSYYPMIMTGRINPWTRQLHDVTNLPSFFRFPAMQKLTMFEHDSYTTKFVFNVY